MNIPSGTLQCGLMTIEQARNLIQAGRYLTVAGDETALRQLPVGNWIGGTIPYFMADSGGCKDQQRVFVNEIPVFDDAPLIRFYDTQGLSRVGINAPNNGFSIIILPGMSEIHANFARNAPFFEDMYLKPLAGWVSGVALEELGKTSPKVVHGQTGKFSETHAIVIEVPLPPDRHAFIDIVNPFVPGQGPTVVFPSGGFSVEECLIDGKRQNFAKYIVDNDVDIRLPMVADYCGALVNVSVRSIDKESGRVDLYAPVFPDVTYRWAEPLDDLERSLEAVLPKLDRPPTFSCNCILNYLYGDLEGRHTNGFLGPITFGEVAYQLVNQTLVYLAVESV